MNEYTITVQFDVESDKPITNEQRDQLRDHFARVLNRTNFDVRLGHSDDAPQVDVVDINVEDV